MAPSAEASIVLLGAVLRSVETLLCRLTGEVWPHDGRECEQQSGYTHPGDSNMYYTQVHCSGICSFFFSKFYIF